jgi:hypothetical protein
MQKQGGQQGAYARRGARCRRKAGSKEARAAVADGLVGMEVSGQIKNRKRVEGQTKEPAEPVQHALRLQIPAPVSMVRFFGQQPCAETLCAALQDAEFLVPVRVGELDELCRKRHTRRTHHTHQTHHARRTWHTRTRRHESSPLVHRSRSYCASHPTLYYLCAHARAKCQVERGAVADTTVGPQAHSGRL